MDIGQEMGVQSYCFRHFKDNARTASLVTECGLARIEICGVQVDFQDTASFDSAIGAYREPLSGRPILLASLPIKSVEPTVSERSLPDAHQAAGAEDRGKRLVPRSADRCPWRRR